MKKKVFLGVFIGVLIAALAVYGLYYFGIISFNDKKEADNKKDKEIKEDVVIHEAKDYVTIEEENFDGSKATIKKVKFNYLDENLTKEFYEEQDKIIKEVKEVSNKDLFEGEYDLKYSINNNILSVVYLLNVSSEIGSCNSKKAIINIDLLNNKIVSEEELLDAAGTSYKEIVNDLYDEELESWTKINENIGTEMSYYEVTYDDFKNNKDKYVNIGLEKIPKIIYTYIEDGKVKYDYYTIAFSTLFHQVGKGGCFNWGTVEVGEYK